MLARQWQLGEFEGEDSGSAVCVKLKAREYQIRKVLINKSDNIWIDYDQNIPLETLIEKNNLEIITQIKKQDSADATSSTYLRTPVLDLQMRCTLGLQFQQEIYTVLQDKNIPIEKIREIKQYLASENQTPTYNLSFDNLNEKQEEFEMDVTKEYLNVIKGRVIDIYKIFHVAEGSIYFKK